jgi:hypothetical protein
MAMHESGVNYQNLIRDLAEIYPFDVDEVVLVELIANSLDAKPTRISIEFDPYKRILVVTDNGKGMTASDFDQYHDFAAGLKTRGTGIGFAGVGAKISFNIATRVITETYSESFTGGSNWYLQSKKKLVWEDIQPKHLHEHGTRVEVIFSQNATLTNSSTEDLIKLIKRYYLPLLDMKYLDLYERLGYYCRDLRFVVNGQVITPGKLIEDFTLEKVREFFPQKAGKRIGYGIFGLASSEYPLGANICGVLLCTLGKVIKTDLFNQFPGSIGSRILGVVEIPGFVNFLTTAKTDFIRRSKYRKFESLYNPVRQEFKSWLGELGIQPSEISGTDEAIKLERELKKLLDDIPELSEFFGPPTKKITMQPDSNGITNARSQEGIEETFPIGEGEKGERSGVVDRGEQPGQSLEEDKKTGTEPAKPISRVSPRGPKITFIEAPEREDLAWVDGNNVAINSGHPSYDKVRSDATARRLHNLFSIASAVQRFMATESKVKELMFIDKMMAAWGKKK